MPVVSSPRPEKLASIGLVVGGALWGLFWIPMRLIEGLGVGGAWPAALVYAAALVLLLPVALLRRQMLVAHRRKLAMSGLFTGAAFSLYAISLLLTDVIHVLLLFYLTPLWGTLLGLFFLGERLTVHRAVALASGFLGLLVVLGIGAKFPMPENLGDWLALLAGMLWAYGSLLLYQYREVRPVDQVFAFIVGGFAVTCAVLGLGILSGTTALGIGLPLDRFVGAAPWVLITAIYVLPMLFLTIWPAMLLTPGRVGLLLMSEAIVGVVSAALFAGEAFGVRDVIGTTLIAGAILAEVFERSENDDALVDRPQGQGG